MWRRLRARECPRLPPAGGRHTARAGSADRAKAQNEAMAGANEEAAGLLREHAEPIPITGGDSFRARNCPRAASSVAGHADDVTAEAAAAVRKITGTGKSIAGKIIAHPLTRRTGRRPSAGAGP